MSKTASAGILRWKVRRPCRPATVLSTPDAPWIGTLPEGRRPSGLKITAAQINFSVLPLCASPISVKGFLARYDPKTPLREGVTLFALARNLTRIYFERVVDISARTQRASGDARMRFGAAASPTIEEIPHARE